MMCNVITFKTKINYKDAFMYIKLYIYNLQTVNKSPAPHMQDD